MSALFMHHNVEFSENVIDLKDVGLNVQDLFLALGNQRLIVLDGVLKQEVLFLEFLCLQQMRALVQSRRTILSVGRAYSLLLYCLLRPDDKVLLLLLQTVRDLFEFGHAPGELLLELLVQELWLVDVSHRHGNTSAARRNRLQLVHLLFGTLGDLHSVLNRMCSCCMCKWCGNYCYQRLRKGLGSQR